MITAPDASHNHLMSRGTSSPLRMGYTPLFAVTYKHGQDALLTSWPKNQEQWELNPVIQFNVADAVQVNPGDRILAATKMVTTGRNTGGIVNVFYIIEEIVSIATDAQRQYITAKAKRIEV